MDCPKRRGSLASEVAPCCNPVVSVRLKAVSLGLFLAMTACKGSASVSVNVNDAPSDKGDDEAVTDDPADDGARGRSVEGHSHSGVPTATFPGFTMNEDGTSRVFLEVSADVPVSESKNQLMLSYRFAGVTVPEKVNRLPIPTTHFETPVASIQVLQIDGAAELRITLRQDTEPKTRLTRSPGGTVLSVDFPKWRAGQQGRATANQGGQQDAPLQP